MPIDHIELVTINLPVGAYQTHLQNSNSKKFISLKRIVYKRDHGFIVCKSGTKTNSIRNGSNAKQSHGKKKRK